MKHIAHQTQYAIVLQSRRRGCQPGSGRYDHIVSQTAQQHDHLLGFKTLLVPLADAQTLLVPFERGLYSSCTGYLAHPSSKMPTSPSPLSICLTVLATSVIRSQKNLFGSVTMHQMSGYDIATLAYYTSIYFFRSYGGIAYFFRS